MHTVLKRLTEVVRETVQDRTAVAVNVVADKVAAAAWDERLEVSAHVLIGKYKQQSSVCEPVVMYYCLRKTVHLYVMCTSMPVVHKNRKRMRAVNNHRTCHGVETHPSRQSWDAWPLVCQATSGDPSWEVVGSLPSRHSTSLSCVITEEGAVHSPSNEREKHSTVAPMLRNEMACHTTTVYPSDMCCSARIKRGGRGNEFSFKIVSWFPTVANHNLYNVLMVIWCSRLNVYRSIVEVQKISDTRHDYGSVTEDNMHSMLMPLLATVEHARRYPPSKISTIVMHIKSCGAALEEHDNSPTLTSIVPIERGDSDGLQHRSLCITFCVRFKIHGKYAESSCHVAGSNDSN
ncbi:hypothetical protein BDY19DRAFT_905258 [Irpex rosettiformis]|uniref:Uncharacterized protein n=1 Tax=Irpex rosettiformis TaxID=378272 RepID=A0ACB8U8C4_9APHY|nr:hypothetical protein BDY19DRAFT_905258 [Irpex rosettiformis]